MEQNNPMFYMACGVMVGMIYILCSRVLPCADDKEEKYYSEVLPCADDKEEKYDLPPAYQDKPSHVIVTGFPEPTS